MFFIKDDEVKLSEASETKTPYSILHPCWQRKSLPRELIGSRCHSFVNSTYSQWFSTTICVNFPDATISKKVSKRERKYMLCICQDFRNCASDLFLTVQPQPLCLSSVNSEQIISFCVDLKKYSFSLFLWSSGFAVSANCFYLRMSQDVIFKWPSCLSILSFKSSYPLTNVNRNDARHHDSESNLTPRIIKGRKEKSI